jgi:hypothetical protein
MRKVDQSGRDIKKESNRRQTTQSNRLQKKTDLKHIWKRQ